MNKEMIVVRAAVNTAQVKFLSLLVKMFIQGRDPLLPGWVKIQSGQVTTQLHVKWQWAQIGQINPGASRYPDFCDIVHVLHVIF